MSDAGSGAVPVPSDAILERMMALHPKFMDLTLDRMHRILATLDHPEARMPPVIHIAGTNGKGSTQAMIRAGLEAAGDRVHAYTSPHLARFHERIRLAGSLIAEPELEALLTRAESANGPDQITYFEITTAAALLAFAETPAEWTLLEVGLGGRLDATNVVAHPALTVITPVDYDHQQYLGTTLTEIAGEKAGILRRGVTCVVAPQPDEAEAAIEARAARLGAPLFRHGQDWMVREENGRMVYEDGDGLLDLPLPRLIGAHQVVNAGSAVAALRCLGRGDAEAAVTRADWPARMQRLRRGPLAERAAAAGAGAELWLDGGHNPQAGRALAAVFDRMPARPTHAICGMLDTKDIGGFLRPLAPHLASLHAVSIPDAPATLPAAATAAAATAEGIRATEAADVGAALDDILAEDPGARVLICGSLYLAGDILKRNG